MNGRKGERDGDGDGTEIFARSRLVLGAEDGE